ncbi:MAG: tetratricopeptide repeat protein [Alloprevotella sp.]|nr:tetratricopeptide repeat protein [Alloprevotella sp.]MBR1445853.1 tetratricopeptide repeat protein [Alloprevotella sp.]
MQEVYAEIARLTDAGQPEEAVALALKHVSSTTTDATLHYLIGRARMKQGRWGDAISAFLKAEAADPDGPAREAREMLDDILAFYNKDMYNQ